MDPSVAAEQVMVELLAACQAAWLAVFPSLHRRAQWHMVHYLCTRAQSGASVGELHGLVKQVFLLDDATVKERVVELLRDGFCEADPDQILSARMIVLPSARLLTQFNAYVQLLGDALVHALRALGNPAAAVARGPSSARRAEALACHDLVREHWSAALDAALLRLRLSPARRFEAKRHLLSLSHATIVQLLLEQALQHPQLHDESGLLADQVAATLLPLNGQNFHTTRAHIAALMDAGLIERRRGKSLRIGLAPAAVEVFSEALRGMAAALTSRAGSRSDAVCGDEEDTVQLKTIAGRARRSATLRVRVISPKEAVREVAAGSEPLLVGRAPACGLVLDAPKVSRSHCRIEAKGDAVLVTDLGSRNGTFVNGKRIEATARVGPDDELEIGDFVLACTLVGAAGASTTVAVAPTAGPRNQASERNRNFRH
jgi:hypothetical protein